MPELNDFMAISDFFYNLLGMFPYKDPKRYVSRRTKIIMNIIFWTCYINLNVDVLAEIIYLVKAFGTFSSFLEATALAPCIGFCLVSEFKLYLIWKMSSDIIELMNGLHELYPTDENSQKLFKTDYYLQKTLRLGKLYSIILLITVWTFNLIPLGWSLVEFYTSSDANEEFKWRLPYLIWRPFEINSVPVYLAVYATHMLGGWTAAGGCFACDIFMFNLIFLLCMNFNYIEENIGRKTDFYKLIKHHQITLE